MIPTLLLSTLACTGVDTTTEAFVITSGSATLDVPEGAAPEGVDINVMLNDPGVPLPNGYEGTGNIYAFTPHGTQFSEPVTITLAYNAPLVEAELAVLQLDDENDDTWAAVADVTWTEDRCTFTTRSFSFYGPAVLTGTDTGDTQTTDTGDTQTSDTDTDTDTGGTASLNDQDKDGYDSAKFGGSDCDDSDATVYPGASEICDGKDNDCNGLVDEGAVDASTWYRDADSDGWGDPDATTESCEQPSGYVDRPGDCDDADAKIYPGSGC